MNETELIAAALGGDEDAFTELYQQHLGYVKAVGHAILHKDDLDDMCQDTFLLAFTRLHSFARNSRFRTWITRIAINQCLMTLRRERQVSNGDCHLVQMDGGPELLGGSCVLAREDIHLKGVPARLDAERFLKSLKPFKRRVLELTYLEDMTEQEIAEVLGVAPSCVKKTIQRAKQQMKKNDDMSPF
jgi:RNA polymerase sigma-70 factor, ECF subfamily